MNIPGLDLTWKLTHSALRGANVIKPWDLEQCKTAIGKGAGVLVVANTALGDSILCTPLLETLAGTLGPERVGFLIRSTYRDLYEKDPRIGHLFTVDGKYRGLGPLKEKMRASRVQFQVGLIANCTEPDLIPWLWWCGVRGFLRYRSRWSEWAQWFANKDMMRTPSAADYATRHAIENNLAMAYALGIKPKTQELKLIVRGDATASTKNLVLIHPGASRVTKQWPLSCWKKIIEHIQKTHPFKIAITGSEQEKGLAAELVKSLSTPVENWAGTLSLAELAKRQKEAAVFLSGDTGPYHMAIAVGCPTVTIFAPTDRGSSTEACGPYMANPAKHIAIETKSYDRTIETVSPASVITAIEKVLSE